MKRHSILRTSQLSVLLLGTGIGLVSLATSTYAQTSNQLPTVGLCQPDEMTSDYEFAVKEADSHDRNRMKLRVPDSISLIQLTPGSGLNRLQPSRKAQPEIVTESIRSPSDLLAATDTSRWKQASRVSADVVRTPAILSGILEPDGGYEQELNSNPLAEKLPKKAPSFDYLNRCQVKPVSNGGVSRTKIAPLGLANSLNSISVDAFKLPQPIKPAVNHKTKNSDSIQVDSGAFEQIASHQPSVSQLDVPEIQPPAALEFAIKTKSKNTSKFKPANLQNESVSTNRQLKPLINKENHFSHIQISASMEQLDQSAPVAIPTTIRTPISIAEQTNWVASNEILQPLKATEKISTPMEVSAANKVSGNSKSRKHEIKAPVFDLESEFAPASVSVFIEGPDLLKVNQTGDYEIAVVNSAAEATSVRSISLRIPESAEMLVIDGGAQINDLQRTLTWSIEELASGQQKRIRFRLKVGSAGEFDFPVTVSQDGRQSQTISQTTAVK